MILFIIQSWGIDFSDYDYDDYNIDNGNNDYWDFSNDYSNWGIDFSNYDYDDYNIDYGSYFNDYYYDTGTDGSSDWWSFLDPYWKKSDWTYEGDGLWSIEDPDSGYLYLYDESDGSFYCMDDDGTIYQYNKRNNDWSRL